MAKLKSVDRRAAQLRPTEEILKESEAFFMKEGRVHATLKQLSEDLDHERQVP